MVVCISAKWKTNGMQQIIALGCSLTAQPGYVNYFNNTHNLNITNLAASAGSNELQSFKLNNLLVNNQVSRDSILLWQLTTPWRTLRTFTNSDSEPFNSNCGFPGENIFHDCIYENTGLFSEPSLMLLCNHAYFANYWHNPTYNLHMTICDIVKWSFLVEEVIVYLGWSFSDTQEHIDTSLKFLSTFKNITVIPKEHSILDVCNDNKWPIKEDQHPTEDSYINWAKQVLEPVLFSKIKN